MLKDANEKAQAGHAQEALEIYSKILDQKADSIPALRGRGAAFMLLGQFEKAERDFDLVLEAEPKDAITLYNRAFAYRKQKKLENAYEDYHEAIVQGYDNGELRQHLGEVCFALGKIEEAISHTEVGSEFEPSTALHRFNRGMYLSATGRHSEALTAYNQGLKLEPNNDTGYVLRGLAFDKLGNADLAEADRQKAQKINSGWNFSYK